GASTNMLTRVELRRRHRWRFQHLIVVMSEHSAPVRSRNVRNDGGMIQLELDKYLPQVGSSLLSLSTDCADKKYRRESASVVDDFFSEEKPITPYSLNINLILPSTAHLRTGLYRPNNKTLAPQQIKTEPDLEVPCSIPTTTSTQALPDFTSVFNVHHVTSNVFIKPDLSAEAGVVSVPSGSQQQQHSADLTMTLSHNSPSAHGSAGGRAITAPHSLPPSPPNSQPGSPDGQAEPLSLASQPPPPYQQRVVKMAGLTPHALLMTHGQGVLTGPKYNRRNNPELEKRRIHFCDYPGDHMDNTTLQEKTFLQRDQLPTAALNRTKP
uniref:Kruppel like factor 5 like n=1 Tax=Takifugu rubripes TaxID=31033 RepID=A0A674NG46_TAKRU